MNLLSKFEEVKIDSLGYIDDQDQKTFEALQAECIDALKAVDLTLSFLDKNPFSNSYYKNSELVKQLEQGKKGMKIKFANDIRDHLESKYGVTILSFDFENFKDIDYIDVLDKIIQNLGGYTFKEKAFFEIQKSIANHIYKPNVSVKNVTVNIKNFIHFASITYIMYEQDKLKHLLNAIEYFETEKVILRNELKELLWRRDREDWLNSYSCLTTNKVKALKSFKNSSFQLKFDSNASALAFAQTFLKYSESVTANGRI